MERRSFLRGLSGAASAGALSGCATLGGLGDPGPFTVTVDYPGAWDGVVGGSDDRRHVDGTGRERYEVEGSAVAAIAQKQDAGTGRLTVTVAVGGDVVAEQSTDGLFGAVSLFHRRGEDGSSTGDGQSPESTVSPPSLGDPSAAVTVTVFSDFTCRNCRWLYRDLLAELRDQYLSEGIAVYLHRNFPVSGRGVAAWEAPHAAHAVQAAAGDAAFFEYADRLFANRDSLGPETYAGLADDIGVDGETVRSAVAESRYDARIAGDREYGAVRGVRSTPTVWVDGEPVESLTYTSIARAIELAR